MVAWSEQAQIKRRWAEVNRLDLEYEIQGFETGHLYPVEREFDRDASCYRFRIEVNALPPIENWALRMGDVIHNLRASLDHLVYALAADCRGKPVKGTAFPIVVKGDAEHPAEAVWRAQRRASLRGIPPSARDIVNDFQPYKRPYGPNDRLAVLHDIDVTDKHKTIEVLALAVGGGSGGPLPVEDIGGPVWHPVAVEDGAEVATWVVPGPEVDVNVEPGYVVKVDDRWRVLTPWSVVPLLRDLSAAVDEVFAALLPFFKT